MIVNEWRRKVTVAIKKKNKERLLHDCHKKYGGQQVPKTKTKIIIEKINKTDYTRKPEETILRMTKLETKTLITARYGMLECGKNFGGTIAGSCSECNVYNDENHRLNYCKRWKETNNYNASEKIVFDEVHSEDIATLRRIIEKLQFVWNTRNASGTMNQIRSSATNTFKNL